MTLCRCALRTVRRWLVPAGVCLTFGCVTAPPAPAPVEVREPPVPPPKVIVVAEQTLSDPALLETIETSIATHLLNQGIPVVDPAMVRMNSEKIESILRNAGDTEGAARLRNQYGADVLLRVRADTRLIATNLAGSNLRRYRGTVILRAINADNAQLLATESQAADVLALDDPSGFLKAAQSATASSATAIRPPMLAAWREYRRTQSAADTPTASRSLSISGALAAEEVAETPLTAVRPPAGYKPPVTAVWRLTPQTGVDAAWMDPLTDSIQTILIQAGWLRLVSRMDMAKVLEEHNVQLSDLCESTEQAVEFGKILNAQKMVIGSVGKLGTTHVVVVKLVDVQTGEIESAGEASARGGADAVYKLGRKAVTEMVNAWVARHTTGQTGGSGT